MVQRAFFAVFLFAGTVQAAVIPSWRENPLSAAAFAVNPILGGSYSVSLMVELSGGSTFNVAGLDLTDTLPGAGYFNPWNFDPYPPNLDWFPFPPSLYPDLLYDTYVKTTVGQPGVPAVPGRFRGPGVPLVGNGGFNVAWGAIPNTGGEGLFEIARITVMGVGGQPIVLTPVDGALVDAAGLRTPLPPMPFPVPEPAAAGLVGLVVACGRGVRREE